MPASFPAGMLNQMPSDLGILNRFKLDPSCSRPNGHIYLEFEPLYYSPYRTANFFSSATRWRGLPKVLSSTELSPQFKH
jgi:hypothetical protein